MQSGSGRGARGGVLNLSDVRAAPARAGAQQGTRARILKAAREIFFRDGFADTNLDEVASRAEVGKGTLYRHFESKAELYAAVLAAGGAVFDDGMRAACERGATSLERLRSIGRFYRRYWSEHPEYFFIFSAVHFQDFIGQLPSALVGEVRSIWERPLRRLEQVIADGVRRGELRRCDPWVMANVIWSTGNAAVAALVTPRRARVIDCSAEALYESTLELLLWGLDARSAGNADSESGSTRCSVGARGALRGSSGASSRRPPDS